MIQVNFELSPVLQERYPELTAGECPKFQMITRDEYETRTLSDLRGKLFIVVNNLISDVYCESDLGDKELKKYVIERERELISEHAGPLNHLNK